MVKQEKAPVKLQNLRSKREKKWLCPKERERPNVIMLYSFECPKDAQKGVND